MWRGYYRRQIKKAWKYFLDGYMTYSNVADIVITLYRFLFKSRVRHFFCKALQSYNSPAARARELFKPSTDLASLLVEIEKTFFRFGFGVFWGNATSWGVLAFFGHLYLGLDINPLGHSFGARFVRKLGQNPRLYSPWMAFYISVAKIMDKKQKICENVCTQKPQPEVEYTSFLNGHRSPADRARELFKAAQIGKDL